MGICISTCLEPDGPEQVPLVNRLPSYEEGYDRVALSLFLKACCMHAAHGGGEQAMDLHLRASRIAPNMHIEAHEPLAKYVLLVHNVKTRTVVTTGLLHYLSK
jgi:hypothetical protein